MITGNINDYGLGFNVDADLHVASLFQTFASRFCTVFFAMKCFLPNKKPRKTCHTPIADH
jgi:hypothetical protein